MRKTLIAMTAASLLFGGTLSTVAIGSGTAHAAEAVYTTTLKIGMSSPAVTKLQTNLATLGYFTYPTATGYFGSITAESVSAYQRDYGLPVTGAADPATLTSIDRAIVKKRLIADTYNYIGTKYTWGGSSPTTGFDCSGFVYFMMNKFGIPSTRTTSAVLFQQGTPVARTALRPGDLVFFSLGTPGVVSHVGFYVGNNQFISATSSAGIYVQSLNSTYWGPKYLGAKRVY